MASSTFYLLCIYKAKNGVFPTRTARFFPIVAPIVRRYDKKVRFTVLVFVAGWFGKLQVCRLQQSVPI